MFSDEEIEVSGIILDLPYLISVSESRLRFPFRWGAKRRRSNSDLSPSPPRIHPSSSPSLPRTCQGESETERRPKVKVEATSPATPLSFSSSESDEKSKHSLRKNSKKRTKGELLEIIDGLTQRRELLRGEIETVRSYYDKLKVFNLELKAKKQELSSSLKRETPYLEMSKDNLQTESGQQYQISMVAHQQPFIMDLTAYKSQIIQKFQYPYGQKASLLSSSGLGSVNHIGLDCLVGIPDLNVSAEETFGLNSSQPSDLNRSLADNRAKAAEARMRRRIKIREMKNSCAAIRPPRCR